MNTDDADQPKIRTDTYRERLLKYVPVEGLAFYVMVYGIVYFLSGSEAWFPIVARIIFFAGMAGTVLYLFYVERVTDLVQLILSMFGLAVWVAALGVVTASEFPWYNQIVASLLLPAYLLVTPLFGGIPDRW